MKLKPHYIAFFLFFGAITMAGTANAQESSYIEREEDRLNYPYEKGDEYSESTHEQSTATNQVVNSNTNNSGKSSVKEEEDEDVLSFNFLYYIIQRYKMSDIVEQKK